MTVSKAYCILEMEGVLARRRGLGMTVTERPQSAHSMAGRTELLRPTLKRRPSKRASSNSTQTPSSPSLKR